MSALPAPQPGPRVEDMIVTVAEGVRDGSLSAVSTKSEAIHIYEWFRVNDPGTLLDYIQREVIDLLSQRIQMSLARSRNSGRKSAFAAYARGELPPVEAFTRQYYCPDGVWRRAGDMRKPDWLYVAEDRAARSAANLFEVEFAKRVAAKLPDDTTPTRAVLTETQLEKLEQDSMKVADKFRERVRPK